MFLRTKIGFTIFALYEIIVVVILHCERMCNPLLGAVACQDWMRYFIAAVIIPVLAFLIWMWVSAIIHARRHRFLHRARGAIMDVVGHVRESITRNVSREDIERYITGAAIAGVKNYAKRNPKFKKFLQDIMDGEFDLGFDDNEPKKRNKK